MKIVLSGYERTKQIEPSVRYLLKKYLPDGFEVSFLNNTLGIQSWSSFMSGYLKNMKDKLIILGDGDFLINKPMDVSTYEKLLSLVKEDVVCARLCYSSFYKDDEYTIKDGIMTLTDKAPYSAVLQYCIWDREFLINLLGKTTDPWNFESQGSVELNKTGKKVIGTKDGALSYFELGAFSHEKNLDKINVKGVSEKDLEELLIKGYLNRENIL